MPWLRVDDGFPEHPKLLALKRSQRWTWLEVLAYCARQANGGRVPVGLSETMKWITPAFLEQCAEVGLLDRDEEGYVVHDWIIYNGDTVEARVVAYLDRHPDSSANEVQRAIGGKRELVLEVVRRYQENGSHAST